MKKFLWTLLLVPTALLAQTQTNPLTQINWPLSTGSGAPAQYCPTESTGQVAAGSAAIILTSMTGVVVNQVVVGAGIPAGASVKVINFSTSTITLSQAATSSGSAVVLRFYSYGMPYTDVAGGSQYICAVNGWVKSVGGTVTQVTATAPVQSSGSVAPVISMHVADASDNGYLSSTDWSAFNGKASLSGATFTGPVSITPPPMQPALTMTTTFSSGNGNRGYFNYANITGSNTQGYAGYDVVQDFDSLGTGKHMIGHESDCWVTLTPSAYSGCWGYVAGLTAPANSAVYRGAGFNAESGAPSGGTPPQWNFGFHTNDGAAAFSFYTGASCTPTIADPTPTCNSQLMGFNGINAGVDVLATIQSTPNGSIFLEPNATGFNGLAGTTEALGTFMSPPIATVASTPSASQAYLLQGWDGSSINQAEIQATGNGDLFLGAATGKAVYSIGEFIVQGPNALVSATGYANGRSHPNIIDNNGFSTASAPDYSYWYSSGDGIYHPAGNQIGIAVGGAPGLLVTNDSLGTIKTTVSTLANANGVTIPPTLTGYHGSGVGDVKVQFSDGTGTSGYAAVYDSTGGLTDGGGAPALLSGATFTGPLSFSGSGTASTTLANLGGAALSGATFTGPVSFTPSTGQYGINATGIDYAAAVFTNNHSSSTIETPAENALEDTLYLSGTAYRGYAAQSSIFGNPLVTNNHLIGNVSTVYAPSIAKTTSGGWGYVAQLVDQTTETGYIGGSGFRVEAGGGQPQWVAGIHTRQL